MNCKICNKRIPKQRLKAVPDTEYCVNCVDEHSDTMVGITVWDKTCPTTLVVNESDANEYWRLERGEGRFGRF